MRRNLRDNHLLKNRIRFGLGGAAYCGFFVWIILAFPTGFVSGTEPNQPAKGFVLQNPMEKQFNASQSVPQPETESRFAKRSQFTDDTIPQTVVKTAVEPIPEPISERVPKTISESVAKPTKKIRQVSDETSSAPPSVWDNPNGSVKSEMTLADWGVGSSSTIPLNPTVPISSFDNSNVYSNPNDSHSYSNTETPATVSPSENPYAALYVQGMNSGAYGGAYGGYGYYNPNTGQAFVNPYNPDANYSNYYGNYYGNYPAAGYNGDNSGYNNGYYGQGMFQPSHPYSVGDNTGNEMPGQQNSLYQALLLQELMLRQRETAAAEKAENGEYQDSGKKKKTGNKDKEKDSPEPQWSMQQLMPLQVSSPLGETLLSGVKMLSPFCTPTGPNRGVGQPLLNRSWLDHPYYFGGYCGWISGSQLVSGLIDQKNGGTGGLIFGYNLNEYWGIEGRANFASIDIKETAQGADAFKAWYNEQFPDSTVTPTLTTRTNQISAVDVAVHYYPLGNAKWRPFMKYGLGLGRESFTDTYDQKHRNNTVMMPLGIGLRYWWNENLAIQADLLDNVVFSSGMTKTQNNFAFCVGLTYAFGNSKKKRPTAYWPYTPSQGSKR